MSTPSLGTRISAHSTALICQDTDLRGEITIGQGTIVHPKASIQAIGGPVVIGDNCVVEEKAVILNRGKTTMVIGNNNMFMIGCRVESPSVGNDNVFHPRCKTSNLVHVSNSCNIYSGTVLLPLDLSGTVEETIPPYTVIYGSESLRRTWDASGESGEKNLREKHMGFLREIMPKQNRMRVV